MGSERKWCRRRNVTDIRLRRRLRHRSILMITHSHLALALCIYSPPTMDEGEGEEVGERVEGEMDEGGEKVDEGGGNREEVSR